MHVITECDDNTITMAVYTQMKMICLTNQMDLYSLNNDNIYV